MVNVVTAGRFKGKRIKADCEGVFISFGREHLDINADYQDYYVKVCEEHGLNVEDIQDENEISEYEED